MNGGQGQPLLGAVVVGHRAATCPTARKAVEGTSRDCCPGRAENGKTERGSGQQSENPSQAALVGTGSGGNHGDPKLSRTTCGGDPAQPIGID